MTEIRISDCDHKDVDPELAVFSQSGHRFEWLKCQTEDDVIRECQGAKVLLNQYAPMNENVFEHVPSLRCIVRYGVGVDNIDVEAATRYGVQVCNVPDYGVNEVADHALSLMLVLVRKINFINALTKQGIWDYQRAIPIHRGRTQTVGIIGVGRIGAAFAERVAAMGYRVLGCDIEYGKPKRRFPEFVEFMELDELLQQSDIVSIHCSLNEKTKSLLNAFHISKMKRGSYLVNVSRGGIVDEQAMLDAIEQGQLGGAAIDVASKEPLPKGHPLLMSDKIIVTPHMAWYSEESAVELKRKCAEEALRFIRNEPVRYPINTIDL